MSSCIDASKKIERDDIGDISTRAVPHERAGVRRCRSRASHPRLAACGALRHGAGLWVESPRWARSPPAWRRHAVRAALRPEPPDARLTIAPSGPAALSLRDRSAGDLAGRQPAHVASGIMQPRSSSAPRQPRRGPSRGGCPDPRFRITLTGKRSSSSTNTRAEKGAARRRRGRNASHLWWRQYRGWPADRTGRSCSRATRTRPVFYSWAPPTRSPGCLRAPAVNKVRPDHLWPSFLPGGQAVLLPPSSARAARTTRQVAVLDLRTGARKVLLQGGSDARYVPTGHLVYSATGFLHAIPFDLSRLEVTGPSVRILPKRCPPRWGRGAFDVAADGTLVYVRGAIGRAERSSGSIDAVSSSRSRRRHACIGILASHLTALASRWTFAIRRTTSGSGNSAARR